MHRIALILEESFDTVREGTATLRSLLLTPGPGEGDFVVLLDGRDIRSLTYRFAKGGDWVTGGVLHDLVLFAVESCLREQGLLKPLNDIGIKASFSSGLTRLHDVVMLEPI